MAVKDARPARGKSGVDTTLDPHDRMLLKLFFRRFERKHEGGKELIDDLV